MNTYLDIVDNLDEARNIIKREAIELQQKVDSADKIETIEEFASFFWSIKQAYAELDEARKLIYHQLDRLDKSIFPEYLERLGTDKVRVPELGRSFYVTKKFSVKQLDKEGVMEWLRNNGGADVIQETVNASVLTSFVQDLMIEQGIDPPEGVLELTSYNTIGSSKYNAAKSK